MNKIRLVPIALFTLIIALFFPPAIYSQTEAPEPIRVSAADILEEKPIKPSDPMGISFITEAVVLTLLALAPFLIMLLSSFTKIIIVLSLLRNAIGAQQSPPNTVLNGIALILTLFIMFPTGLEMYQASKSELEAIPQGTYLISGGSADAVIRVTNKAKEPLRKFILKHTDANHIRMFFQLALKSVPPEYHEMVTTEHFAVIIPSFVVTQIKNAFEIAVLIYLPFFIVDIVTSNILLAMGMQMLSPMTISLPLKLLLLVVVDGWTLIIQGLALSYL